MPMQESASATAAKKGEQDHGKAARGKGVFDDACMVFNGVDDFAWIDGGRGAANGAHNRPGIVLGA